MSSLGIWSGQCPTHNEGSPHPALSLWYGCSGLPRAPCTFAACQLHTCAPASGEGNTRPPGPQDGGAGISQWAETYTRGDGYAENNTAMVWLWQQDSLSLESLPLQQTVCEKNIVYKVWPICSLSEDCCGLSKGRYTMTVANRTHSPFRQFAYQWRSLQHLPLLTSPENDIS